MRIQFGAYYKILPARQHGVKQVDVSGQSVPVTRVESFNLAELVLNLAEVLHWRDSDDSETIVISPKAAASIRQKMADYDADYRANLAEANGPVDSKEYSLAQPTPLDAAADDTQMQLLAAGKNCADENFVARIRSRVTQLPQLRPVVWFDPKQSCYSLVDIEFPTTTA